MRPGTSELSRSTIAKKKTLNSFRKKEESPVQAQHIQTEPAEVGQIYDLMYMIDEIESRRLSNRNNASLRESTFRLRVLSVK
jgi:hypothetical protein